MMMKDEPAPLQQPANDEACDIHETTCCVVGAGPAGAVLALLLARRGVDVVLLEAHQDFDREFRGDTLHPAILEILDEIGLAERLHELPHTKVYGPVVPTARGSIRPFDLRRLKTKFPYIMFMQQTIFLKFLTDEASKYPSFRLIMGASVQRLVEDDGNVRGVCYKADDGWHEIRAALTVGADGRFSRLRHLAGFEPIQTSETLELLQFRLPHLPDEPDESKLLHQNSDAPSLGVTAADFSSPIFPLFGQGRIVIVQNRSDHWQIWQIFPAGEYKQLRDAGVESLRRGIVELEPRFAKHVEHLTDWQQVNLLSVASSRCPQWYKPGLLLIGDAAHTMTPAAGAGIKYAVEDAVVAANLLAEPLKANKLDVRDLAKVQRQRQWPTWFIQALSAIAVKQILKFVRSKGPPRFPLLARLLIRTPMVRYIAPQVVAFGISRVHVASSADSVRIDSTAWLVNTMIAAVLAGILSGVPSTAWAFATGTDPWEATIAVGAAVVGADAPFGRLLAAAAVAHGTMSIFWAGVLCACLPARRSLFWGAVAGGLIALLDSLVISRFITPIRALAFLPQLADHLMFGAVVGACIRFRRRNNGGNTTG